MEAIREGVPARTLKDELARLEAKQDELKALLAEQPLSPKPLLHPSLPELYRRKVAELQASLEEESTKAEAAGLIRSLVEAVVLVPENGEL